MRKPKKINIADQVMSEIDRRGITMRSRNNVLIVQNIKMVIFVFLATLFGLALTSVIYLLLNDTFSSYLDFANGTRLLLLSLPWQGITLTTAFGLGLLFVGKQILEQPKAIKRSSLAMVVIFLLVPFLAFGMMSSKANTPKIFASIGNFSDKDPIKTYGIIERIDGETVIIKLNGQEVRLSNISSDNLKNLKPGDKLLIIGEKDGNEIEVKVYKIIVKAKPKEEPKPIEVEKEPEPEPEKEEEKEPEKITTTVKPAPAPTPAPTPEPTPVQSFTVKSISQVDENVTVTFKLGVATSGKCMMQLKNNTTLAKVTSGYNANYWDHPEPLSECTVFIAKSSLASGTYSYSGIGYFKYPFNVWTSYYQVNFSVTVTAP